MDFDTVVGFAIFLETAYAVVAVDYLDVFISVITSVSVHKAVVTAQDGIILDAVSVQDVYLHAIVSDKKMSAAFHDGTCGIIKQVVNVKF